jgi:hypothetical protein
MSNPVKFVKADAFQTALGAMALPQSAEPDEFSEADEIDHDGIGFLEASVRPKLASAINSLRDAKAQCELVLIDAASELTADEIAEISHTNFYLLAEHEIEVLTQLTETLSYAADGIDGGIRQLWDVPQDINSESVTEQ